jgi:hypothetical protein
MQLDFPKLNIMLHHVLLYFFSFQNSLSRTHYTVLLNLYWEVFEDINFYEGSNLNVETLKDFSIHFTISCNFLCVCSHVLHFPVPLSRGWCLDWLSWRSKWRHNQRQFVIVYQVFLLFLLFATCLINIDLKQLLIQLLPMWI